MIQYVMLANVLYLDLFYSCKMLATSKKQVHQWYSYSLLANNFRKNIFKCRGEGFCMTHMS